MEQPDNIGASDPQATESLLRSMTQDIENLRQNLVVQLSQDLERLQREKSLLIEDIDKLQTQRQQQIIQQQQLLQQIAPALANQLQELLTQQLNQLVDPSVVSNQEATPSARSGSGSSQPSTTRDYNENAHRLIASLDSTLRTTFRTLQQDLSSYQSSLSQQLGQMYSLEQQGEAILETLVSRLREKIQAESSAIKNAPLAPPTPTPPLVPRPDTNGYQEDNYNAPGGSSELSASVVPLVPEPEPTPTVPQSPPPPKKASKAQIGFLLVLLSSLVLSFQNIVIKVILKNSSIFGLFKLGGFITPSVGNSLLILWLRMLVVVPVMAVLATVLYPKVWQDIKQFVQSKDWPLFCQVVGSGFFLFLSQVLIYLALGPISPGVAITIFFVYPIFTVLLAWLMFGDRPTPFRGLIIISVLLGVILISLPASGAAKLSAWGIAAAAGSGITFAFYVILTQACAKKLNPIPYSWINFLVIFAFSSLSLSILPDVFPIKINYSMWPDLLISCLILGATTLLSYLFNNIGISLIGAARASILGATGPALTALLAVVIIQSTLQTQQVLGMLLVTLGVAALSFERLRSQKKAAQLAVRKAK